MRFASRVQLRSFRLILVALTPRRPAHTHRSPTILHRTRSRTGSRKTALCLGLVFLGSTLGCAGPSRQSLEERRIATERLMEAQAVYLPPEDRDSCVGIVIRLSADESRSGLAADAQTPLISAGEARAALQDSGYLECAQRFEDGRVRRGLGPESVVLRFGYGVDPEGRVCAAVEHDRPEVLDPRAASLVEEAARCAKDGLFRAQFPRDRVDGKDRVILVARLALTSRVETATVGAQ